MCAQSRADCTSSASAVEVVYFLSLFRAWLMHLSAVLVLKLMATLVNSFIFDSSWDVLQDLTMDDLYVRGWQDYSNTSVMNNKINVRPHAICIVSQDRKTIIQFVVALARDVLGLESLYTLIHVYVCSCSRTTDTVGKQSIVTKPRPTDL